MMRRLGGLGHPDFERDLYELARQHLADRAKLRTFFERPQPDRVARYFRIVAELERQETGRRRRAWLASLGGSLIRFLAGIALSGRARPEVRDFADAEPGFGRVRWSNRRRRSRRGKKLARIAAVASLSLMVAGGGLFAWAWHHSGPLLAAAEANLTCGNAIRLVDIVGRTTALLPADGCRGARQHLTAPFDDADLVSDLAAKVGSIEGAWRVEETFLGQDLVGVARKIASELGLLGPRGATGPLQSAFESLAGSPHAAGFFEKVVLVVAGSRFITKHLPDDQSRADFIVHRMPVLVDVGWPLAGAAGADAIFDGPPLGLLDQCMFARMAGFPLRTSGEDAIPIEMARRWMKIIGPATAACVRIQANDDITRNDALSDLADLCLGTNACIAPDPALDQGARDALAMRVAGHSLPRLRPPQVLPGGGSGVLRNQLRRQGLSNIAANFSLTIDSAAQAELAARIDRHLHALERRLPESSCLVGACRNRLDHLVAIAEIDGESLPLRAVSTSAADSLVGPIQRSGAGWTRLPPRFGQASLAKILLALVAANAGDERLCDLGFGDLEDPGGGRGVTSCDAATGAGFVPTRRALARSLNLPFRTVAARHALEVVLLQDQLDFLGEPWPDVATGAVLGVGRVAPPATFMTLFAAILNGGASESLSAISGTNAARVDLVEMGYEMSAIRKTAEWLRGPVEPGGTLHRTVRLVNAPGCRIDAGKTGTHAGSVAGGTSVRLSKIALVSARCGSRRFVIHASISAGDAAVGIAPITHADLAPLITAALASVTETAGGT